MKNPSFSVTALAISALTIVAVFKVVSLRFLPPSEVDRTLTLPNNRSLPAPLIEVGWRSSLEEAAQEAKRKNLGLFVFCLDPTSLQARQWETNLFRESELVRVIRRHFIPVKLLSEQEKYLAGLILPLGRTQTYSLPGVSATALLPDGTLLSHIEVKSTASFVDFKLMRDFLLSAKEQYESATSLFPKPSDLQKKQNVELARLSQQTKSTQFDPTPFYQRLLITTKHPGGGFQIGPFFEFRPAVLRLSNRVWGKQNSDRLIQQTFRIGLFDPLDGGLFRRTMEDGKVDVSRDMMANALALQCLAEYTIQFKSKEGLNWTKEIFRFLKTQPSKLRSIPSDQTADDRSPRYSITQRKMSEFLTSQESDWLTRNLLPADPRFQEFLRPTSRFITTSKEWIGIREKLISKLPKIEPFKIEPSPEVEGYVAARLFQTSRIFEDMEIQAEAIKRSNDVYGSVLSGAYQTDMPLADLLGIVDCSTEDFLATRNQVSLAQAIKVFRVAMGIASIKGSIIPLITGDQSFWKVAGPELSDPGRESITTLYLRLCDTLGQLNPDRKEGASWINRSQQIRNQLAPFLAQTDPHCASLVDQFFREPITVFVSGSVGKASFRELQAAFPTLKVIRPPAGQKTLAPIEVRRWNESIRVTNLAELQKAVENQTPNRS